MVAATAQFGLNVFEGIRAYKSAHTDQLLLFRFDDHIDRLEHSCGLLDLAMPYNRPAIANAVNSVVAANSYTNDVAVRVTILIADEGSWSSMGPTDMFVAPIERPRRTRPLANGVAACVSSWERIDDRSFPPLAKVGANYINGRYAHLEAQRNGYDLPLLMNRRGTLAEGAGSCAFIYRNGVLSTPNLASSILESITRDTVLSIAAELNIEVTQREISRSELYLAEEVFLCGSAAEITPVSSIDRRQVGDGTVGEITDAIHEQYLRVVTGHADQIPDGWLTPLVPCT